MTVSSTSSFFHHPSKRGSESDTGATRPSKLSLKRIRSTSNTSPHKHQPFSQASLSKPLPARPSTPIPTTVPLPSLSKLRSKSSTLSRALGSISLPTKSVLPLRLNTSTKPVAAKPPATIGHQRSRSEGRGSAKAIMEYMRTGLPPTPVSPSTDAASRLPRSTMDAIDAQSGSNVDCMSSPTIKSILDSLEDFISLESDHDESMPSSSLPPTPTSAAFPSTDNVSTKSASSNSSKTVRWAKLPLFPEQQSLINIHGLLSSLMDSDRCDSDVLDSCEVLSRFLPQPGVESERKYMLRTSQEEELERSLRILDGALIRDVDEETFSIASASLKRLATVVQHRFATLPYHRDLQKLKAERTQLKEERSAVLAQLANQETEIKSAQQRRQAEREREIQEATIRKTKRKEEKLKEKENYQYYRRLLDKHSEELREVNRRIEEENERLIKAREDREAKTVRRVLRVRNKTDMSGSVRLNTVSFDDGKRCWI
ncbi:hypothetical protein CPB86DRAFT_550083 [Serendipita vermifera]|nr:hypothetical protein CPB86DRAFT_550083 [Serendipita vermifera]